MSTKIQLTQAQSTYLDFIRAAAAMSVLFGHASLLFLQNSFFEKMDIQSMGVIAFFLMSGFLITYSVVRKHSDPEYTFRDYFIDRFCRIYCVFLPALVFVWLMDSQTVSLLQGDHSAMPWHIPGIEDRINLHTWFGNLFMLQDFPLFQIARHAGIPLDQNFLSSFGSGSTFWTLSIEWWLYMTFGMIAYYVVKHPRPYTHKTLFFIIILGAASIEPLYFATNHFLSFIWLFGMLTCLLFTKLPDILDKNKINPSKRKWTTVCASI